MRLFPNIGYLISEIDSLHWDAAIFVNRQQWTESPTDTQLLYLEGDDELEDIADEKLQLPRLAADMSMRQLLDVQTLQDVVKHQSGLNQESSVLDYVYAINYYLEKDDLFDGSTY